MIGSTARTADTGAGTGTVVSVRPGPDATNTQRRCTCWADAPATHARATDPTVHSET
ncbi:hypothetical protein HCC61_29285 [Streptomyces sp. HNM0575]|uniref:hypothetical protein n=1 Tax=Streptomyces sp. HNM0575 TaxID=2716338 RepID=UPI00145F4D0A|nr:hypothetical protein [Streptomyces sp. HNM0575]NLU76667.1 hypothetical protein [Streptomyces sp. HNM0575]